jgi:hypothetical protein
MPYGHGLDVAADHAEQSREKAVHVIEDRKRQVGIPLEHFKPAALVHD